MSQQERVGAREKEKKRFTEKKSCISNVIYHLREGESISSASHRLTHTHTHTQPPSRHFKQKVREPTTMTWWTNRIEPPIGRMDSALSHNKRRFAIVHLYRAIFASLQVSITQSRGASESRRSSMEDARGKGQMRCAQEWPGRRVLFNNNAS